MTRNEGIFKGGSSVTSWKIIANVLIYERGSVWNIYDAVWIDDPKWLGNQVGSVIFKYPDVGGARARFSRGRGGRGGGELFSSSSLLGFARSCPRFLVEEGPWHSREKPIRRAWRRGRDPLRFKPMAPVILSWDGIRGRRGKEMRLKSVVRSSVDRSELNYEEMLEFWSSLPIFLPSFLSFFRDCKVENDANIFVK